MSWLDDTVSVYQLALHCNENSLAETRALLSEVLQRAIEEAARRVRDTDQEEAKSATYYAQLGDAAATREACAEAIEAMLDPEVKR